MNGLRYNDATNVFRKELPSELAYTATSDVYLTVYDDSGSARVARAEATVYTPTTLSAAATAGDSTFTLSVGAGALEPGDRIRILDSNDGPDEDVIVSFYNATSRTVTPTESLHYSHASGSSVVGLWATATIDTTDTATFTKGRQFIFAWEHAADETSRFKFEPDLYEVGWFGFGTDDALERFATRFPELHLKIEERRMKVLEEARKELKFDCAARGCNIERIIDQDVLMIPLVYKIAIIAAGVSDQYQVERESLLKEYISQFDKLMSMPIWVDEDQDLAQEDAELKTHQQLSWGRGL